MRFRVTKKQDGELQFHGSRKWVRMRMSELAAGEYTMEMRKYIKKRSNQQNAYYWAVVVPMIKEGLVNNGYDEIQDLDDAHEVIKELFFRKTIFSTQSGELERTVSTTKFSTTEFAEKIDAILKWAFTFLGVTIPLPGTQQALDFYDDPPGVEETPLPELTEELKF